MDWENRIVRELKPNTPTGIDKGLRQLRRYQRELQDVYGGDWTTFLDLYQ